MQNNSIVVGGQNVAFYDFVGDTFFLNRKTLSIDYVDVATGVEI